MPLQMCIEIYRVMNFINAKFRILQLLFYIRTLINYLNTVFCETKSENLSRKRKEMSVGSKGHPLDFYNNHLEVVSNF